MDVTIDEVTTCSIIGDVSNALRSIRGGERFCVGVHLRDAYYTLEPTVDVATNRITQGKILCSAKAGRLCTQDEIAAVRKMFTLASATYNRHIPFVECT